MSKKRPLLGAICKGDNGSYIKLNENVTILVDGEEIPIRKTQKGNRNLYLQSPLENVEFLYSKGYIKDEEIEQQREKAAEINTWKKYDIVIPLPKD